MACRDLLFKWTLHNSKVLQLPGKGTKEKKGAKLDRSIA